MKNLEKKIQTAGINLAELNLEQQKSYNGGGREPGKQTAWRDWIYKYLGI